MAQTFNDFVAECEGYKHSKEHYDIMKECSEIALCEQFIEDQAYIAENVAELTGVVNFTESYFSEAASDDQIKALYEKVETKKGNVLARIWAALKKAVAAVVKFFKNIAAKWSKTSVAAAEAYKALKEAKITNEQYEELAKKLEAVAAETDLAIEKGQTFVVELGVTGAAPVKYHKYFAVALSNTNVNLGLKGRDDVVEAKTLVKILDKFAKDKKKYDFASTGKLITAAREDARKNGVTVYANDKALEKLVAKLGELQNMVEEKKLDAEVKEDFDAEGTGEMAATWTMISGTVAGTLKQYGAYSAYRVKALEAIKAFLDSKK